jgi:hypothetical protein
MKILSRFIIAAGCLALAGCIPESVNPIAPASQSFVDSRLEGVWVTHNDGGKDHTYYHFQHRRSEGQDKKATVSNWLDIVGIGHNRKGSLEHNAYAALPARIGKHKYLSYAIEDGHGKKNASAKYCFARYEFSLRGRLKIYLADNDAFVEAVRSGQLRGKVKTGKDGSSVKITDSSENIAAFVEKTGNAKLFGGKPMLLHREN